MKPEFCSECGEQLSHLDPPDWMLRQLHEDAHVRSQEEKGLIEYINNRLRGKLR